MHYDGWLALPVDARKHLNLNTGDRLEVELTKDSIVLRPNGEERSTVFEEQRVAPARTANAPADAAPAHEPSEPKRGRGRPRKPVAPDPIPRIKVGGRRKTKTLV